MQSEKEKKISSFSTGFEPATPTLEWRSGALLRGCWSSVSVEPLRWRGKLPALRLRSLRTSSREAGSSWPRVSGSSKVELDATSSSTPITTNDSQGRPSSPRCTT